MTETSPDSPARSWQPRRLAGGRLMLALPLAFIAVGAMLITRAIAGGGSALLGVAIVLFFGGLGTIGAAMVTIESRNLVDRSDPRLFLPDLTRAPSVVRYSALTVGLMARGCLVAASGCFAWVVPASHGNLVGDAVGLALFATPAGLVFAPLGVFLPPPSSAGAALRRRGDRPPRLGHRPALGGNPRW